MTGISEQKTRSLLRVSRLSAALALLTGSLVGAGVMVSFQYSLSRPAVQNGGANTVSTSYKVQTGVLGQAVSGSAQSESYVISGAFVALPAAVPALSAPDLSDAYVYPNPFKPNSPGSFQAAKLTFKHLPAQTKIAIFAITGKRVAELHKTDSTVDYYEWNATNGDGQQLASGVYLYFMTSPDGSKAKGKFAVIR